jgi:cysteine-rich repeat protein
MESGLPGPFCGNGILDSGEKCDDGNIINGDGCTGACVREWAGLSNIRLDIPPVAVGSVTQIVATAFFDDGNLKNITSPNTNPGVKYSSSDTSVAKIACPGCSKILGVSLGKTVISVKYTENGITKTDSRAVTVLSELPAGTTESGVTPDEVESPSIPPIKTEEITTESAPAGFTAPVVPAGEEAGVPPATEQAPAEVESVAPAAEGTPKMPAEVIVPEEPAAEGGPLAPSAEVAPAENIAGAPSQETAPSEIPLIREITGEGATGQTVEEETGVPRGEERAAGESMKMAAAKRETERFPFVPAAAAGAAIIVLSGLFLFLSGRRKHAAAGGAGVVDRTVVYIPSTEKEEKPEPAGEEITGKEQPKEFNWVESDQEEAREEIKDEVNNESVDQENLDREEAEREFKDVDKYEKQKRELKTMDWDQTETHKKD